MEGPFPSIENSDNSIKVIAINSYNFFICGIAYLFVQAAFRMVIVAGRYIAIGFVRCNSGIIIANGITIQ